MSYQSYDYVSTVQYLAQGSAIDNGDNLDCVPHPLLQTGECCFLLRAAQP